jgi:hypothetical protein
VQGEGPTRKHQPVLLQGRRVLTPGPGKVLDGVTNPGGEAVMWPVQLQHLMKKDPHDGWSRPPGRNPNPGQNVPGRPG